MIIIKIGSTGPSRKIEILYKMFLQAYKHMRQEKLKKTQLMLSSLLFLWHTVPVSTAWNSLFAVHCTSFHCLELLICSTLYQFPLPRTPYLWYTVPVSIARNSLFAVHSTSFHCLELLICGTLYQFPLPGTPYLWCTVAVSTARNPSKLSKFYDIIHLFSTRGHKHL